MIWDWVVTSRADNGSSATINLGFNARALAIQILCLCLLTTRVDIGLDKNHRVSLH